jgi:hypothetical protein
LKLDSLFHTSAEPFNRRRRNTYTTFQVEQSFFTDRKANNPPTGSVLQKKYSKQQCQKCRDRNDLVYIEHQRLENENKKLNEQLRSSVFLNHRYEEENDKLKHYLRKLNGNLSEYQMNFNQLKQKILSEKKISSKLDEENEQDHLKRLRYEVHMYNRIVAAKEQQEKQNQQKQIEFFF